MQFENCSRTDKRISLISNILKGIKQIKMKMSEAVNLNAVKEVRAEEISTFGLYVNIKQICSSIYFNSGVIISSVIFLFAEPESL